MAKVLVHDINLSWKINVRFEYPPIPIRSCDWIATFDDYEGESSDPMGFGETPQEAVIDLISSLNENLKKDQ